MNDVRPMDGLMSAANAGGFGLGMRLPLELVIVNDPEELAVSGGLVPRTPSLYLPGAEEAPRPPSRRAAERSRRSRPEELPPEPTEIPLAPDWMRRGALRPVPHL